MKTFNTKCPGVNMLLKREINVSSQPILQTQPIASYQRSERCQGCFLFFVLDNFDKLLVFETSLEDASCVH